MRNKKAVGLTACRFFVNQQLMNSKQKFKYIYGPVYSWRMGMSLGVDPIGTQGKVCSLNCVYCQLGPTDILTPKRKEFVPASAIIDEIKRLPRALPRARLDFITFSGRGEPTLAKNLGEMIRGVRRLRKEKIAVITNSVSLGEKKVREDLALADFVLVKLDACDEKTFLKVNRPASGVNFKRVLAGIKAFRKIFRGRLALQIMFTGGNKVCAAQLAKISREVPFDEIEINTPLRPCGVKPLSPAQLLKIKKFFSGQPAKTVYEARKKEFQPFDEKDTVHRHGQYKKT
jgi:wyosine [tRNA(Phe)-imidazoG37] synthetase (radical SAM superfamily)